VAKSAPDLRIYFPRIPLRITYAYTKNVWTVHHEEQVVQDVYRGLFRDAVESGETLFRQYTAHPRLDILHELAKNWEYEIENETELRSWLATHNRGRVY